MRVGVAAGGLFLALTMLAFVAVMTVRAPAPAPIPPIGETPPTLPPLPETLIADPLPPAVLPAIAPLPVAPVSSCQPRIDTAMGTRGIRFKAGSAVIAARDRRIVRALARALHSCPGATFAIAGGGDAGRDARYNALLTDARAAALRDALVNEGIPLARLAVVTDAGPKGSVAVRANP